MEVILYLFIGAFSSFIGTTTGLAGGVILFGFLGIFFPVSVLVPMHATLQIGSNASRTIALRKDLQLKTLLFFFLLVIPGAYFGTIVGNKIDKILLEHFMGGIIVLVALKNLTRRSKSKSRKESKVLLIILGFLSSFFGMIIGIVAHF